MLRHRAAILVSSLAILGATIGAVVAEGPGLKERALAAVSIAEDAQPEKRSGVVNRLSPELLAIEAREQGLTPSIEDLTDQVEIRENSDGRVIEIDATGATPEEATAIANVYATGVARALTQIPPLDSAAVFVDDFEAPVGLSHYPSFFELDAGITSPIYGQARFGRGSALLVCEETSPCAVWKTLNHNFLPGHTYRVAIWLRSEGAEGTVEVPASLAFGTGRGDGVVDDEISMGPTWQVRTIKWSPEEAVGVAEFAVEADLEARDGLLLDGLALFDLGTEEVSAGLDRGEVARTMAQLPTVRVFFARPAGPTRPTGTAKVALFGAAVGLVIGMLLIIVMRTAGRRSRT